jgi:hypothetical protein
MIRSQIEGVEKYGGPRVANSDVVRIAVINKEYGAISL